MSIVSKNNEKSTLDYLDLHANEELFDNTYRNFGDTIQREKERGTMIRKTSSNSSNKLANSYNMKYSKGSIDNLEYLVNSQKKIVIDINVSPRHSPSLNVRFKEDAEASIELD